MAAALNSGNHLTPGMIVAYLDRYVIGQEKAKRAVAIALRNRVRRRKLSPELAQEVAPKNILMVGPTGVGKTEIARRLAKLVDAPFVKIEATKFTEVGYVGRDVESLIRDLVESAVQMSKRRMVEEVQEPAAVRAEERLLDALLPQPAARPRESMPDFMKLFGVPAREAQEEAPSAPGADERQGTREKLREMLRAGRLENREVEIEVSEAPKLGVSFIGGANMEEMGINLSEMLGGMMPKRGKRKKMTVAAARMILQAEEAERLVDMERVTAEALERAQEEGIVFLDEIDKVARGSSSQSGPDVSREGVQRDLLPIVEGCVVQTKYGPVHTDHILFIAAGAFHKNKPSDLAPELQGRLPIRVEMLPLKKEDLVRILKEPENSLTRQYQALLGADGVTLEFAEDAFGAIAELATRMNAEMENIGARRLHTMMELLLEDVSFDAPFGEERTVTVDARFVEEKLGDLAKDQDARKYLL